MTRFGKPLADVVPAKPDASKASWLGAMRGRGTMADDLIAPAEDVAAWDALK